MSNKQDSTTGRSLVDLRNARSAARRFIVGRVLPHIERHYSGSPIVQKILRETNAKLQRSRIARIERAHERLEELRCQRARVRQAMGMRENDPLSPGASRQTPPFGSDSRQVPPLIVFTHIPKTAGTSLAEFFRQNIPQSSLVELYNAVSEISPPAVPANFEEIAHTLEAILGHVPHAFAPHKALDRDKCLVTVLRDPVDRVLSHYFYTKIKDETNQLSMLINEKDISLREFVSAPYTLAVDNLLVRYLCDEDPRSIDWGECTEQMLDQAKHNLAYQYDIIGLTESYDAFVEEMRWVFGFDQPIDSYANVNKKRPKVDEIDRETLDAIAGLNRFDIELFEFARQLVTPTGDTRNQ